MVRILPPLLLLLVAVGLITLVTVQRVRAGRRAQNDDALPRTTAAVVATYGVLLVVAVVVGLFVIALLG